MAEYGISYRDIANGAQVSIGTVQNVLYGTSNLDRIIDTIVAARSHWLSIFSRKRFMGTLTSFSLATP